MTVMSHPLRDSATMLRRNLSHVRRNPSMTVPLIGTPIVLMLLFVYVFGGTMGAGLPEASDGRAAYLDYVVPGIMVMTAATVAQGTTIAVFSDMSQGIIARFRTMPISRGSILTGHVVGATIQLVVSVAVIVGLALLLGYRAGAGVLDWLGVVGMTVLIGFALSWITTAMGMASTSIEVAGSMPMPLMFLPLLGSGFVPTESMPTVLRWFADYQPFTPMIESLRGLLAGAPDAGAVWGAGAWSVVIALVGWLWSRGRFERVAS